MDGNDVFRDCRRYFLQGSPNYLSTILLSFAQIISGSPCTLCISLFTSQVLIRREIGVSQQNAQDIKSKGDNICFKSVIRLLCLYVCVCVCVCACASAHPRYRTAGYSFRVAHSVASCSARRSITEFFSWVLWGL